MTIPSSLLHFAIITMMAASPVEVTDPLIGAWSGHGTREGRATEVLVIFTAAHQVAVWFDPVNGDVVHTNGGLWSRSGTHVTEVVEFHSDNPGRVGTSVSFDIELTDTELSIVGTEMQLTRIDRSDDDKLGGAWRLIERMESGRWVADETALMTVRLMSASRFQEIVFDPESGVLVSTVGGEYDLDSGDLVETLQFRHSDPRAAGERVRFSVRRETETWRQTNDWVGRAWREREP